MNLYKYNQFGLDRRIGFIISLIATITISVILGFIVVQDGMYGLGTVAKVMAMPFILLVFIRYVWAPRGFSTLPQTGQLFLVVALMLFVIFF